MTSQPLVQLNGALTPSGVSSVAIEQYRQHQDRLSPDELELLAQQSPIHIIPRIRLPILHLISVPPLSKSISYAGVGTRSLYLFLMQV
jgi:hypothetical protein